MYPAFSWPCYSLCPVNLRAWDFGTVLWGGLYSDAVYIGLLPIRGRKDFQGGRSTGILKSIKIGLFYYLSLAQKNLLGS